jgi:hypothetical protein
MNPQFPTIDRRELLSRSGLGFGSLGLASLLNDDGLLSSEARATETPINPLAPKQPHFPATAKRVIHIFLNGGCSHVDTFDPKPELTKWHGKELPTPNLKTERPTGAAFGSPYKFRKYGESGIEVSELFHNTAQSIDDICVVRSMHADVPNHEPSLLLMNCGEARLVRPSVGSWVTYGLGSENQNLPGFIAMWRVSDPGIAELAGRISARRLPGDPPRHKQYRTRKTDRQYPKRLGFEDESEKTA